MFFSVSFPLLYYKRMPLCSVYGILNVVVYFDRTKLINHDSSMKLFVEVEDKLFRDKVSCDWSRGGHVVTILTSDWSTRPTPSRSSSAGM